MKLRGRVILFVSFFITALAFLYLQRDRALRRNEQQEWRGIGGIQVSQSTVDKKHSVEQNTSSATAACQYPQLNPWDKGMMKFFKDLPRTECNTDTKDWVRVIDGKFVILPHASEKFGKISCQFSPFTFETDFVTAEGSKMPIENNTRMDYDFFRAYCEGSSGRKYTNIHAGIRHDKNLLNKTNLVTSGMGLDVLIIGFDSVSRMTFMRKMPKTYKYLIDTLGAVVLKGYNIQGDGTPHALIPILTGKTELEFPRPLQRLNNGVRTDVYSMVWKEFAKMGYVSAWSEDNPSVGTFTYRMTGFEKQPTDHYMRPFHLKLYRKEELDRHKELCLGDRPRVRVVLDWMNDFMRMYRNQPKFGFMFHNELSHGSTNGLQTGDDDLKETLSDMYKDGLLDNTMLIVMADHGARFSSIRETLQGKQEERNPFFSYVLPKSFKVKYPKAFKNLQLNSERLVTPFDIHPTFLDLLDFKGTGLGDKTQRDISLFKEIPLDRTCSDARVAPHWCNCLNWITLPQTGPQALAAAKAVVDHINKLTNEKRELCVELSLDHIVRAIVSQPSKEVLSFAGNKNDKVFEPNMNAKTRVEKEPIQLTLYTSPNGGLYECTLERNIKDGTFRIETDDISRINKYGDDEHCIHDTAEQLRKFCLCKDRLPSKSSR